MEKINLFQTIKSIINDTYNNAIKEGNKPFISRQQIICELKSKYNLTPINDYSYHSLDTVRNLLEKAGYLDKVIIDNKIKSGCFIINILIPKDLSQTKLRQQYNNNLHAYYNRG